MINVLSLYDSSPNVSSSEMASSNACDMQDKHSGQSEIRNQQDSYKYIRPRVAAYILIGAWKFCSAISENTT